MRPGKGAVDRLSTGATLLVAVLLLHVGQGGAGMHAAVRRPSSADCCAAERSPILAFGAECARHSQLILMMMEALLAPSVRVCWCYVCWGGGAEHATMGMAFLS